MHVRMKGLVRVRRSAHRSPNKPTEHELDHVLQGTYEGEPILNPLEAANWKWMLPEDVKKDIQNHPDTYTPWFKIIFEKYYAYLS